MSLTALVFTVCSMHTMQCVNYVGRLYATPAVCQYDAVGARRLVRTGPIFVRCVPTTK